MSFIKTDHKAAEEAAENSEFTPIEPGEYEVFITAVDMDVVSKNKGTQGVECVFTVREDIDQDHKKKKVWETFWTADAAGNPSKALPRLLRLLSVIGAPDGAEMTKEEVKAALLYKPVRIEVLNETYLSTKTGKDEIKAVCSYMGFKPATKGGRYTPPADEATGAAPSDDPFANDNNPIDIRDDDLPF